MVAPTEITGDDLAQWATRIDAAPMLPDLVRRLLLATAALRSLSIPAHGGTRLPGWDGVVNATTAGAFWPEGASVWEFSTSEQVARKLNEDFEKRTVEPPTLIDRARTTYVAVTARRFGQQSKAAWIAAQQERGWTDVRVLDADDLAAWLAQAPAVACWFAAHLGIPVDGLTDVEEFLSRWEGRGRELPLPSELAVAGAARQEAAERLREKWLTHPQPMPLHVQGDTKEEALVFVAAALASAPSREQWLARALVIESREAWRWVTRLHRSQPLILLPNFEEFEAGDAATSRAFIVVPQAADSRAVAHVKLAPIPFKPFAEVLVRKGVSSTTAERLAYQSGGKLSEYQRLIGGLIELPVWARGVPPAPLYAMLLAGAWDPRNEADREFMRRLGADPNDVERLCVDLSRAPERPIRRNHEEWGAGSWGWDAPAGAWKALAHGLTEELLQTFAEASVDAMGELDPQYLLPADERFRAPIHGKTPRHSEAIREGLSVSIIQLSLNAAEMTATRGAAPGPGLVEVIIQRLLQPDWRRWASLSELLPNMAEAAPVEFLSSVERSLESGEGGVAHLLKLEASHGILGPSPHTGLLWALEAMAWHPDLMPRVVRILARLGEVDPGGQLANRPGASLLNILRATEPQTAAPAEQRARMLADILRRFPNFGWKITLQLMEEVLEPSLLLSPSERPKHLEWNLPPDGRQVSIEDLNGQLTETFTLLLHHAGQSLERWLDMLKSANRLPESMAIKMLDALLSARATISDPEHGIWRAVRVELEESYRIHEDGETSSKTVREQLAKIHQQLTPEDPVIRCAWLFERSPPILEEHPMEWEWEREAGSRIQAVRFKTLEDIWEHKEHWSMLERLCATRGTQEALGRTLADVSFVADFEERLLEEPRIFSDVIPYFFAKRFTDRGRDFAWLERTLRILLSHGLANEALEIAIRLWPGQTLWSLLDALGEPLRGGYWRRAEIRHVETAQEWEQAIQELLGVGRALDAAWLAHNAKSDFPARPILLVLEALEKVGRAGGDGHARRASDHYLIGQLFEILDRTPSINMEQIINLEKSFFKSLAETRRGPRAWFALLEDDPAEFSSLVGMLYRRNTESTSTEGIGENTESRKDLASFIYKVLSTWKGVPGRKLPDSDAREEKLLSWSKQALEILRATGRETGAVTEVARVLARAPNASDDLWPCMAARKILEQEQGEDLAHALLIAKRNLRGLYARRHQEGGAQERTLANTFRNGAAHLRLDWPKTAAMLELLAKSYEDQAERADAAARSERLKHGWELDQARSARPEPSPRSNSSSEASSQSAMSIDILELDGIASAPAARIELAPRLSLLAGDNSTGKTLTLDTLWWALTGTWAGEPAWPGPAREGGDRAAIRVGPRMGTSVASYFDATREVWVRPPNWPRTRALVLYARVDGGFDVWDPLRNAVPEANGRADILHSYHFTTETLWEGLRQHGKVHCNGMLRDWLDWQYRRRGLFDRLISALAGLSLPDEPLRPGKPTRVSIHEALDIPTLEMSYGSVPLIHASAAVKRILGLAYLLVWSWNEHQEAARLAGQPEANRILLLIDEVESHLHPRWQRRLLPALLQVIQQMAGQVQVQLVSSTHAPLVMASLESLFDTEQDKILRFELEHGRIAVNELPWAKQGDVVGWLVSEAFGLKQARSQEAEDAIEAAESFMRGELGNETRESIERKLREALAGHDPFWPRWLVETGVVR